MEKESLGIFYNIITETCGMSF